MKTKHIVIILFLLLLMFIIGEMILRPRVIPQSLAEMLYKHNQYKQAENLFKHNNRKADATATANLAKSLYKQEKYSEADSSYALAKEDSKHKGELSFDRGNSAYKQGDYQNALQHYRDALMLLPEDSDVKANYELALRKQQPPPPPKPKEDKKQDKQKEEEIRNILGGLDNKESSDRQQQQKSQSAPKDKWW